MRVQGQLEFAQLEQSIPGSVSAIGARIYADITAPAAIIPRFHDGTAYRGIFLQGLGYLVNADVNASAAIAYSKLNLAASIVNADISASAAIAPSKIAARQVAVGTAQTSTGTVTSTSFANLSNQPTLTFTAAYSGKYKIFTNFPASVGATNVDATFRINNSAGAATINFSQEQVINVNNTSCIYATECWVVATLTAGVSYTFGLQAKSPSSTVSCLSSKATNGVALTAMQIE